MQLPSSLARSFFIFVIILLNGLESHPAEAQARTCLRDYFAKKTLGIAQPAAENLIKDIGKAMAIMGEIQVIPCSYAEQVESTVDEDDDTEVPRGEYIVYNPTWVQQVIGNNKVEAIAVFGHELGHFVQRHFSTRSQIDRIQQEIEADYFAGCAVASMGSPWKPMAELLERIRNENDEVYPNRLKSQEKAKQGYDTCARPKLAMQTPMQSDLKLQVIGDPKMLRFFANGRQFASVDISDYQDGAPINSNDIEYGRNSIAVRLGRDKDMFTIFQVKESDGKLCSKQLFAALRDGDDITITTRNMSLDSTTYGIRFGRLRDLFTEYVAKYPDLTFYYDPRVRKTGEERTPTMEISGTDLDRFSVMDHGCVD
jgi:hypothetical protein